MTLPIAALRDAYAGQTCYVVGKGPSLVNLTADHFGAGPIITLNQAIRTVQALGLPNPLMSMQKDGRHPLTCSGPCAGCAGPGSPIVLPEPGALLLVSVANSRFCLPDYRPRYLFDTEDDFGLLWTMPSITVAIRVAELMGCDRLVLLCMDAITTGDIRTVLDGLSLIDLDDERGESYRDMQRLTDALLAVSRIRDVSWITPQGGM